MLHAAAPDLAGYAVTAKVKNGIQPGNAEVLRARSSALFDLVTLSKPEIFNEGWVSVSSTM